MTDLNQSTSEWWRQEAVLCSSAVGRFSYVLLEVTVPPSYLGCAYRGVPLPFRQISGENTGCGPSDLVVKCI